jgi:predicted transcriptional regulator
MTCISKEEFFKYFAGKSLAYGWKLEAPRTLSRRVPLDELRHLASGFQPPQRHMELKDGNPILAVLKKLL